MKSNYRFAQIFVKLSRVLGVLAFIAGCAFACFQGYQTFSGISEVGYDSNPVLTLRLEHLKEDTSRTVGLLRKILPSTPEPSFPAFLDSYDDSQKFIQLQGALDTTKSQIKQLKHSTIAEFETLIEGLRKKLIEHAREVAGPRKTVIPATPAESAPDVSAAKPAVEEIRDEEHIFGEISNKERRARAEGIASIRVYLEKLEEESQKPENKKTVKDALFQLAGLARLLPSPVELAPTVQPATPARGGEPTVVTRDEVTAEVKATQLQQIISIIRHTILESWSLDDAFEQALTKFSDEKQNCAQAERRVKSMMLNGTTNVILTIVASLIAAFLVLVVSDFLQTQLDIARNTGVLARSPGNNIVAG